MTSKPLRHRAAASADIEHSHSLGNPELFEDPDRKRVPISLVRGEPLPFALPGRIEYITRLRAAHDAQITADPLGMRTNAVLPTAS
ncbi:MAG: hypothetical protein JWR11_1280 [Mycobacterium sp.]|nr:hypothetical protein [Mycobacterium sp.]